MHCLTDNGVWKAKIKVPAGLAHSKGSLLGLSMAFSQCLFIPSLSTCLHSNIPFLEGHHSYWTRSHPDDPILTG